MKFLAAARSQSGSSRGGVLGLRRWCCVLLVVVLGMTGLSSVTSVAAAGAATVSGGIAGVVGRSGSAVGATVVEGTYSVVVADGSDRSEPEEWLRTSDNRYFRLRFSSSDTSEFQANQLLRVSGNVVRSTIEVSSATSLGGLPAASVAAASGTRSVLVMMVYWTAPDATTPAQAVDQIGNLDSAWFSAVSYGQLRLSAVATPWLQVSSTAVCNEGGEHDLLLKAEAQAVANGYNPSAFDHELVYFPNAGCDWAGKGQMPGRISWSNGFMHTGVTVHEFGHNFGLAHSHSLTCTDQGALPVVLGTTCSEIEYGDLFDVMGTAHLAGGFNAVHRDALGWLPGRVQSVSTDSTVSIVPIGRAAGVAAVRVSATTRTYWLEYRQAEGVDSFLGAYPGATDGVLLHVGGVRDGTDLLDGRPATSGNFTDAALRVGSTWLTPEGISIRVNSATTAGASVSIFGLPKVPGAPTGVAASAANAAALVSWVAPANGGSAITQYTVTVSPGGATRSVSGSSTSVVFDGLVNGSSYTFTVRARNAFGDGPVSGPSNVVTPVTVPGQPVNVVASGANAAAVVSWVAPADTGGAPIQGYSVIASPGGAYVDAVSSARSVTVLGLTNGTAYTFTVRAHNWIGVGSSSVSSPAVTPLAPVVAPVVEVRSEVVTRSGYWMLDAAGNVYRFGDARDFGGAASALRAGMFGIYAVHVEPTPSANGYWVVDSLGRVYAFGDAAWLGNADLTRFATGERVSSLSATPTGRGYRIFTSRGRVAVFGDATFLGDMAATHLNGPVLGSVVTASGKGYYMVASDGGIFAFGDAVFHGSMGAARLNAPVRSLVPSASGGGYWLVASDGGIFAFGDAAFRGSMGGARLNRPVVGMVRFGDGYLMVGADGGIFNFSNKVFHGSLGDRPPVMPVTSVAVIDG